MELLIDGYNVIRQSHFLRTAEQENFEAGRLLLLQYLSAYRRLKKHKITVVFDGESSHHLRVQKEKIAGIKVIYSGMGEKADDVIKRMIIKNPNFVVITSDQEIINFAQNHRAMAITTQEFLPKLENAFFSEIKGGEEEEHYSEIAPKKKGPAHRLSKRKRKRQKLLKKL